ncbi:hypothetical protein DFH06DRAFT_534349 [Mycena polygramma]|nr:hypothetical protein DFH06DRAFT_534349 [Mycena polygramma]
MTTPEAALLQPAPLYALRRGRTGAVVEALAGARNRRFRSEGGRCMCLRLIGMTGARMCAAIWEGCSCGNCWSGSGEEGATEVRALVRMRLPPPPQTSPHGTEDATLPPPRAPLAIVFVPASSPALGLRSPTSPAFSSPSSNRGAPSAVQDLFAFDPADRVLSLRRVTLTVEASHMAVAGVRMPLSVSLPAARAAERLSTSASPLVYAGSYARGRSGAGGAGVGDGAIGELVRKEAVVATWGLGRRHGWAKEVEVAEGRPSRRTGWPKRSFPPLPAPRAFSRVQSTSPTNSDYRYQLVIGGAKIDVRREVEVSAFALGSGVGGDVFVERYDSSSPDTAPAPPRPLTSRSPARSPARTIATPARRPCCLCPPTARPSRSAARCPCVRSWGSETSRRAWGACVARCATGGRSSSRARRRRTGTTWRRLCRSSLTRRIRILRCRQRVGEDVFLRVHADREDDDALSATTSRNGEELVASVSPPATRSESTLTWRGARRGSGMRGRPRMSWRWRRRSGSTIYPWWDS